MVSPAVQLYAFLAVVLTGVAATLALDVYRAWRAVCRPRRPLADLADGLFGVLTALLLVGGIFLSNWGDLRLYVAVGLLTGGALYHWLASPVVEPAARRCWRLAAALLRWWARCMLAPLHFAGRVAARMARGTGERLVRGGRDAAVTWGRRTGRSVRDRARRTWRRHRPPPPGGA